MTRTDPGVPALRHRDKLRRASTEHHDRRNRLAAGVSNEEHEPGSCNEPMAMKKLPDNDGWDDIAYDLGVDATENARISRILNEACHVFRHHAEGTWQVHDKDAYAKLLAVELERRPSLAGRLLSTDDRVVKMVTFRAMEIVKARGTKGGGPSSGD